MQTRTEKYRDLREQIAKENKASEKKVDEIFDDMDDLIDNLFTAAKELLEKAREGKNK